ncbi:D-alanyl-D-alanine carboxypeptidase/D-alanyl-D-alanine-endopeptidase [Kitasatospora nipponensis]|uniref:D-alanyl-D-alanine carboxypeptidase/D-alanyl-D-alanine-endopeptidase n=1 Tax=Kitasatospora nipponensis TaxID=258049 RepID=A0ABP4GKM3_9ACTN
MVVAVLAGATGFALLAGGAQAAPQAYRADQAPPPAAAVLQPADTGGTVGMPGQAGLQAALAPLLQDKALGTLTFAISDGATGKLLLGSGEGSPATPASTTKLATAVAALDLLPPTTRLATRVVAGATPADITLVGGGDPTVTGLPLDQVRIGGAPVDADSAPASLAELARQTAVALKAAGVATVHLAYDTSMYTGPVLHKYHDAMNIAAVVPLMVDEGRIDPRSPDEAPARTFDPAGQAADEFAQLLGAQGVAVDGKAKAGQAQPGAAQLAQVLSPTLPRLVDRMLTTSDNTLAEAVARQVALAAHQPPSFDGAAAAVVQTLTKLGVPMQGVSINDGSGLHLQNAIPPLVLADLLALAASPDHPELRPVLTGLPIGAFSGTLIRRFTPAQGSADGAGVVHAKTGSLSGVNTLAGTVVDADGRLLVFALMTRTPAGADQARAAMDRIVARLTACGCG